MLYSILMANGGTYTINGITKDDEGNPIADVVVSLSGNGRNDSTASGPDGSFSFTDIPPGTYTLTAENNELSGQEQVVLPEDASKVTIIIMEGVG